VPDPAPAEDVALLAQAAADAGRIAMRFWRRDPTAWAKADTSPVSEADIAVDTALKAALLSARPGYGWLSEETPDTPARLSADRVFIVDPIDGTRAFLAGEEGFALSLAVAEHGRVIAGVVHLPAMGKIYAAELGGPALLDGRALAVSPRTELAGADVLATRAVFSADLWPGGVPDLKRSFRSSLAHRLCLVAEGRFDAMLALRPAHEWDIAAGSLIATCAGACVTDCQGRPLRFNAAEPVADGTVAAPPALHRQIMAGLGAPQA